ncbi:SOS response-associated peptidase [Rhodobaculum claviforme]|uniref:Abasic site processing protein n=1 Tax=Rhodobaculum claviforme TaxID=1549854 RepID=A0A934WG05_9RHOB|nr:SOS response-associated peptidase [Rhodobaculum claviforme]MBK5926835.1 DUF159 family protein [Rhodobaculum claviforme]
MCGRFTLTHPTEALARLFDAAPANDLPPGPRFNISPTQPVAAVVSDPGGGQDGQQGGRRLTTMRWGFVPSWYDRPGAGPLLINARAEGIADTPAFRAAARTRRCLIPASGFYEWTTEDDGKQPWYIHPPGGEVLALAGVWQVWERDGTRLVTCAIVTCAANAALSALHHRMPVVIAPADQALWLGEAGHGAARLMRPAPDDALAVRKVGRAVNANRADGAALLEAVP